MFARLCVCLAALAAVAIVGTPPAHAQKFQPGSPYICPNDDSTGLDCYLDAVTHLYTMCRHVKGIEIIEFGHQKAQEGVNGAKSDYCVEKQKINITRPYQAALKEVTPWREAIESLRSLQEFWLNSMAQLRWQPGETDDLYQDRVNKIYEELSYRIESVRVGLNTAPETGRVAAKPAASGKGKSATAAKPKAKAN
ncbi:MAG: hypothetical protein ABI777_03100 [Betaproteobacteria bacterium]